MKRVIYIDGLDKSVVLSKVTEVKLDKPMLNLEQLADGTFRLIYSTGLITDIDKVLGLRFVKDEL